MTTSKTTKPTFELKGEQVEAAAEIQRFLDDPKATQMLLDGGAGTGKTYTAKSVMAEGNSRVLYTAPTNKAVRVLRKTLTEPDFIPQCRTIYSALGLTMQPNGEVKEMAIPEDPVDLSSFKLVVLDEGSMVNSQVSGVLDRAQEAFRFKLLVMADFAQLPPVGEQYSPLRNIEWQAHLTTPRRFDNQILKLATDLRAIVDKPFTRVNLPDDNEDGQGVFRLGEASFDARLRDFAGAGNFSTPDGSRVVAWRNATVDRYNKLIRRVIFGPQAETEFWLPGDRIVTESACKNLDGKKIADTGDEGTIERVEVEAHPEYSDMLCFRLTVMTDDNQLIVLRPLHPSSQGVFNRQCEELAQRAKTENKRLWGAFWSLKEAFHGVRHGYAITAHKSQGSTYDSAFVDFRDILINRNAVEARRCLYVACTRPKYQLFLN